MSSKLNINSEPFFLGKISPHKVENFLGNQSIRELEDEIISI
jgi:hypothetical protein